MKIEIKQDPPIVQPKKYILELSEEEMNALVCITGNTAPGTIRDVAIKCNHSFTVDYIPSTQVFAYVVHSIYSTSCSVKKR